MDCIITGSIYNYVCLDYFTLINLYFDIQKVRLDGLINYFT